MVNKTEFRVQAASPEKLGIHENQGKIVFSVNVPDGQAAELLLFRKNEKEPCQEIVLDINDRIGSCCAVSVGMDRAPEYEYCYRIADRLTADPYARSVRFIKNAAGEEEPRCSLDVNYRAKTRPLEIPYADTVFYKLHVRGFTMDRSSGVKAPGTFRGIQEKIPYLKDLGVNALILMPAYEFREVSGEERIYELDGGLQVKEPDISQKKNYWGYDAGLYFAPKARYAASGNPNREFADLVDCLHEAGMECIPEFFFRPDTDCRLVVDVLRHWRLQFHVDGFHLVGSGHWIHAVESEPLLSRTKILYTDFNTELLYGGKAPSFRNLGVMNCYYQHMMRKFLKGDLDVNTEDIAFLQRRNDRETAYVNYMVDQDGFTLADMVAYEEKHNDANGEMSRDGSNDNYTWNCGEEGPTRRNAVRLLRRQQVRNAVLLLVTAQGAPMFYAGDECENSQAGNNNAWCQDNKTGWVNWKKTKKH
jgi:glycogen operon protein